MRSLTHSTAAILGFAMLCVLSSVSVRAETTANYQATDWDQAMVLPPNAYRAAKPIGIQGDFTVKTQPGTLIEGVSFLTRGGVQHWHVEGTLMRRVHITGKRNASGHGIDSAFEDCEFNKDDNWYNFWWSTYWKFDHCIFTKRFIRGELTPLDYGAYAEGCTFYGVKLPTVGFKENPASYLQKDHMGFHKCRFVDCDVPQTFLAATVDCVFEGCRFEPKNKVNWPKETGPIKVNAFYAGTGSEPSSFINGPLTVEFAQAPRGEVYGSTLAHTQSGGRVTLTNLRLSGQFAQLGTVEKKSSEIVDVLAAVSPLTTVNPAPTLTPNPVSVAAGSEVHSLDEMLRAMPANIEVIAGGEPNPAGVEVANAWLAKTYAGHAVSMRLTLENTQATSDDGYAYKANARPQEVLYHGTHIPSRAVAMFRASSAVPLSRVPPSADFPVRGVVRKAEFVGRGHALTFNVTIGESLLADNLATPATPVPAVNVAIPPAGKGGGGYFGTMVPSVAQPTPVPSRVP